MDIQAELIRAKWLNACRYFLSSAQIAECGQLAAQEMERLYPEEFKKKAYSPHEAGEESR